MHNSRFISFARPVALASAALIAVVSAPVRPLPAKAASGALSPRAVFAPLAFEQNDGQHAADIRYLGRGPGYQVAMLDDRVALSLRGGAASPVVTMRFGARTNTRPAGDALQAGRANYFVGRNATDWHVNVPMFGRIRYTRAFEGIDLIFYGQDQQLEYDVVVAPGADPRAARITYEGADALRVDRDGALVVDAGGGELRYSKPVAYQRIDGRRTPVDVSYGTNDRTIGFELGEYDHARELIIDPVVVFSTYFGGRTNDQIYDTVVDSKGSIFVTGGTDSVDFPLARAVQPVKHGIGDAFVAKFTRDGALVYSTYFGGSSVEYGIGIDVDPTGAAYVTGSTPSPDLPTTPGAFQPALSGSDGDAFVLKLTPGGDRIAYLTYLGETTFGGAADIAVDASGNATIVGSTSSAQFPTTPGALDRDNPRRTSKGFAAKLNPTGTALVYGTLLTGNEQRAAGVALDTAGRAVIVGTVAGAMTVTKPPVGTALGDTDAFALKLNPTGSAFVFSVRIGGTAYDAANAVVLDGSDAPHIVGTTYSSNFPTGNFVFQDRLKGVSDAFVLHMMPDGTVRQSYTGLFGGSSGDWGTGIGISGEYVTIFGETGSSDLPLRDPLQGSLRGQTDGFIARLSFRPDLQFATYIGGTRQDVVRSGVVDGAGIMTMTGFTYSTDYPTSHAFQPSNRSGVIDYPDGFITRASLLPRGTPGPRDTVVHVADQAVLHGKWERVADPTAAHGDRLHNPDAGAPKLTQALAAPADYFDVTVDGLFGGPYMVWVRGKADNNSYTNDSVYLQFSNASNAGDDADIERRIFEIGTTEAIAVSLEDCAGCGVHDWGWQDGGYGRRVSGTPVYFNSGLPTTIRVQRREDGISIDQIVLARDDGAAGPYFYSAPGYQQDDDTILPAQQPDVHGRSLDVVLYPGVDGAALHGAWTTVSDAAAAGNARLWHPDAGAPRLSAPLATPANYFDLHFRAEAAVGYRLWIRGKAQNDSWANDSVFLQFSDSTNAEGTAQWRMNTTSATTMNLEDCSGCGLHEWGWQDNGYGTNVLGPLVYFAAGGDHTIRVQTREDGLSIDQIVLSPVNYRDTAPGPTKNDTTIFFRQQP